MNRTQATVNLGPIENIPLGQGRCYLVNATEIAVFRQRDGHWFAVQERCPHRQGPLSDGVIGAGKVICPLHAHQFDLQNGAGVGTGERVKIYSVRELDGKIILEL